MWVYVCGYAYVCAHACVIHVYAYISEHGSTNYPQLSTMATTTQVSTQNLLQTNSPEYQQHLTTRNRIAKILHHQNNIKMSKTIPKQYRPPSSLTVIPTNTELQEDFNKQLQDLFFQHLDKVILHNTIALELENARLQELTHRTKRQHPPQQEPTPSSSTTQTEAPPSKEITNATLLKTQNTSYPTITTNPSTPSQIQLTKLKTTRKRKGEDTLKGACTSNKKQRSNTSHNFLSQGHQPHVRHQT